MSGRQRGTHASEGRIIAISVGCDLHEENYGSLPRCRRDDTCHVMCGISFPFLVVWFARYGLERRQRVLTLYDCRILWTVLEFNEWSFDNWEIYSDKGAAAMSKFYLSEQISYSGLSYSKAQKFVTTNIGKVIWVWLILTWFPLDYSSFP